jgi:UDP-3-O-[3-hydroxymyristoyl] glucosamine N-acyltransferase
MWHKRKSVALVAGLVAMLGVASAQGGSLNKSINLGDNSENDSQSSVNGSISVGDNSVVNGSLSTVNGTIRVGQNTRLKDAETVNGSVRIDSGSSVDDVNSVNGSIRIGEKVTVGGEIEVVNGKISVQKGTTVADGVSNVNGEIELEGADIGGNVATVNGDVTLSDSAVIQGDLLVEKPGGWGFDRTNRKPKVIIGPGSKVLGKIVAEREVELFISETAVVGGVSGAMTMDDAIRFSGDRP